MAEAVKLEGGNTFPSAAASKTPESHTVALTPGDRAVLSSVYNTISEAFHGCFSARCHLAK